MFHKTFLALITVFFTSVMALNITISTNLPYSSGEVSLAPFTDTITFSNGIKILPLQFIAAKNVPEYIIRYCAITFQGPSGKFVYKYNTAISLIKGVMPSYLTLLKGMAYFYHAMGNIDTNWSSANMIPLQTFPSDSIFKREPDSTIMGYNGKILFYYHKDNDQDIGGCIETTQFIEHNSIVYFIPEITGKSAMKIQVDSFELDTSSGLLPSLDYCKQAIVAHIDIRWAVDSLGNGHFKPSTGLKTPPKNDGYRTLKEHKKAIFLGSTSTHKAIRSSGFNVIGRELKTNNSGFPAGMFIRYGY